jgi:hypothetical protein
MDIEKATAITESRLSKEGETMSDLLENFRDRISSVLIGESQWSRILNCAATLPIEMGAFPFGFELPLHEHLPNADLGVSFASGTKTASLFQELQRNDQANWTTEFVDRLFGHMEPNEPYDAVKRRV